MICTKDFIVGEKVVHPRIIDILKLGWAVSTYNIKLYRIAFT